MENLETLGAVTHTHTHTHVLLSDVIIHNYKVFYVPKNKRNLNDDQEIIGHGLGFFLLS